jgi:ribosomal protein L12E/L44/L45/RPP1/RPP2
MVAQVPALVEGLTGVDVSQMIQDIPGVRQNGAATGRGAKAHAGASLPATSATSEGQQPKQERETVAAREPSDGQ